jgi:hypothetical protein
MTPVTSQSPAVNVRLAQFAAVPLVMLVFTVCAFTYSPKLPAAGLSFVAVPLMPTVAAGVMRPVAESVEKD